MWFFKVHWYNDLWRDMTIYVLHHLLDWWLFRYSTKLWKFRSLLCVVGQYSLTFIYECYVWFSVYYFQAFRKALDEQSRTISILTKLCMWVWCLEQINFTFYYQFGDSSFFVLVEITESICLGSACIYCFKLSFLHY